MIAERIKEARERKSMTKAELARRVEVSRASVSMWEDGKSISQTNISRLARVLDVTPEWLQYGVKGNNVEVTNLAYCLAVIREISTRLKWTLTDEQHARIAAYLYSERSRGLQVSEHDLVKLVLVSQEEANMAA